MDKPARQSRRSQRTPTQRALGLLTRREHSRKELARKLVAGGVSREEADGAIERLAAAGWQDEARFAEALVRSRAAGGYGPVRIQAELATHGLPNELVRAALESRETDWAEIATDLVRRRFAAGALEDRAIRRKAAELLFRRGFTAAQVRAAVHLDADD